MISAPSAGRRLRGGGGAARSPSGSDAARPVPGSAAPRRRAPRAAAASPRRARRLGGGGAAAAAARAAGSARAAARGGGGGLPGGGSGAAGGLRGGLRRHLRRDRRHDRRRLPAQVLAALAEVPVAAVLASAALTGPHRRVFLLRCLHPQAVVVPTGLYCSMQRAIAACMSLGDRLVAVDDERGRRRLDSACSSSDQRTPPWSSTRSGTLREATARARARGRARCRAAARARRRGAPSRAAWRAPGPRRARRPSHAASSVEDVARREVGVEVRGQRVEHRDDRVEQLLERADEAHPEVAVLVDRRAARRAGTRGWRRPRGRPSARPRAGSACVPKPAPEKVLYSPFAVAVGAVRHPGLVLPVRRLDDVLAGGDQLVGLEHDVRPGRLGRLLAGHEVRLVDPQDLHELDAVDGVDDPVQLALVERAPERPAVAGAGRVAADERVQVRVQRVRDVLLDARACRRAARPAG